MLAVGETSEARRVVFSDTRDYIDLIGKTQRLAFVANKPGRGNKDPDPTTISKQRNTAKHYMRRARSCGYSTILQLYRSQEIIKESNRTWAESISEKWQCEGSIRYLDELFLQAPDRSRDQPWEKRIAKYHGTGRVVQEDAGLTQESTPLWQHQEWPEMRDLIAHAKAQSLGAEGIVVPEAASSSRTGQPVAGKGKAKRPREESPQPTTHRRRTDWLSDDPHIWSQGDWQPEPYRQWSQQSWWKGGWR